MIPFHMEQTHKAMMPNPIQTKEFGTSKECFRIAILCHFIFVPENSTLLRAVSLYIHTFSKLPPYGFIYRCAVKMVVGPQNWSNSFGGLHSIIMRHCGE